MKPCHDIIVSLSDLISKGVVVDYYYHYHVGDTEGGGGDKTLSMYICTYLGSYLLTYSPP